MQSLGDDGASRGNVSVIHTAVADLAAQPVRTPESIDPRIALSVIELDPQSARYACELTITNVADEEFAVAEVRPCLPRGIKLHEAVDSAHIELNKRHEEICRASSSLLTSAILASDTALSTDMASKLRSSFKVAMRPSGLLDLYAAILVGRVPSVVEAARDRALRVDVRGPEDIDRALEHFSLDDTRPEHKLILFNRDQLRDIEAEDEFQASARGQLALKKGQQFKAIYIVQGTKGALNPTPYSLSFNIVLNRDGYFLSRVEHVALTVPPGWFGPTVVAMLAAIAGVTIKIFGVAPPSAATGERDSLAPVLKLANIDFSSAVERLTVPVLTALIIYNIFDMTSLKDKLPYKRSWRTAILVGFLCGFLTDKILRALGALLS